MAKPDIWMPLYIGDYLADTMHLTTEQHGAYLLLIMAYWKNGGALTSDDRKLMAICRLGADAWSMHKHTLASFFDLNSDPELWIHVRAEKEMEKAGNNQEKRTLRAQKAAEARWSKNAPSNAPGNAPSIPQAMLNECPSPSPSDLKEKDQKLSVKFDQKSAFDIFWKLYPRKVSKAPAEKKFMTKCKDPETFSAIIRSVGDHIQNAWDLSEMNFIPHASTWLNQEKWNDEVSHVRPKTTGANTSRNSNGRSSLVEQVRQRGRQLELERGGQAGYGSPEDAELSDPSAYAGIDWGGEFSRIDVTDGSLMGPDD